MFLQAVLLVLHLLGVVTAATNVNLTSLFGPHLSSGSQIFLPSNANYTVDVTQRWTTWDEPTYLGAIKPATEPDVQTIVSQPWQGDSPDTSMLKEGPERPKARCLLLLLLLNGSIRSRLRRKTISLSSQLEGAMAFRLNLPDNML